MRKARWSEVPWMCLCWWLYRTILCMSMQIEGTVYTSRIVWNTWGQCQKMQELFEIPTNRFQSSNGDWLQLKRLRQSILSQRYLTCSWSRVLPTLTKLQFLWSSCNQLIPWLHSKGRFLTSSNPRITHPIVFLDGMKRKVRPPRNRT